MPLVAYKKAYFVFQQFLTAFRFSIKRDSKTLGHFVIFNTVFRNKYVHKILSTFGLALFFPLSGKPWR